MRIAVLSDVLPPSLGGIETALVTLFQHLPDIDFHLFSQQGAPSPKPWGPQVRFHRLVVPAAVAALISRGLPPRARRPAFLASRALDEWVRHRMLAAINVDLVHIHSFADFRYFAELAARHPSFFSNLLVNHLREFESYQHPVLFTDHSLFGGSPDQFNAIHNGLLVERLRHIVCVERSGKVNVDLYQRVHGLIGKTWWIPNPIDMEKFSPAPLPSLERLVIGYAGRYEKKGTQEVLSIASELPSWLELKLALAGSDSDHERALRKIAGTRARLSWNTPNSKMPDFYRSIHLFVDPWSFGAPRTALEAMACGRGLVRLLEPASFQDDLPLEAFVAIQDRNPKILLRELTKLHDGEKLRSMSAASRGYAETTFSASIVAAKYREVYAAVANSH